MCGCSVNLGKNRRRVKPFLLLPGVGTRRVTMWRYVFPRLPKTTSYRVQHPVHRVHYRFLFLCQILVASVSFSETVTPDFISAAYDGDVARMRHLTDNFSIDVNDADYDKRTALHLAASEGHRDVCEFLLEQGADVNFPDRNFYTPLESALNGKHGDVVEFLNSKGGHIDSRRQSSLVKRMLAACMQGDIKEIERVLMAGCSMQDADQDGRTPLHLAASEGQVQAVMFCLKKGADVNALDRFGNTPLSAARRGMGRLHQAVIQILAENGAVAGTESTSLSGPAFMSSISVSIPLLCERFQFDHAEAWVSSRAGKEMSQVEIFEPIPLEDGAQRQSASNIPNDGSNLISRAFQEQKGFSSTSDEGAADSDKLTHCIPLVQNGETLVVFSFSRELPSEADSNEDSLDSLMMFVPRLIRAGIPGAKTEFASYLGVPAEQPLEAFNELVGLGVFNPNILYAEIDWIYNMGFPPYYFNRFDTPTIARHFHALLAAKKLAKTTGSPEDVWLHIENNPKFLGPGGNEQLLMMFSSDHATCTRAEKRIQDRIALISPDKGYSLEFEKTDKSCTAGGSKELCVYILQTNEYVNPNMSEAASEAATDIWDVSSQSFLQDKTKRVRERYQEIISETHGHLAPMFKVWPEEGDLVPVSISFNQGRGSKISHLLTISELCNQLHLPMRRKFVETFSNGIIIYHLYFEKSSAGEDFESINKKCQLLFQNFSKLFVMPQSSLTNLFLEGTLTAEEYTYMSTTSRFIYYFITQTSEEYNALCHVFEKDPLNLGRLKLLHTTLNREALSLQRILDVLASNRPVVKALCADFKARVTRPQGTPAPPTNQDIITNIKKLGLNTLDTLALLAMVKFNSAVLKTNFYKSRKSSISFRLDPEVMDVNDMWPVTPYGIFFVMSSEFQGFHLRFRDVSRGGIRLIRSRSSGNYQTNMASQFAENYGLAFTQNKKNKDIPEFGSKGTVLLNLDSQQNDFLCFKKYISGLLDLLVLRDENIQDHYNQEELLFLGPDEGTANMMEWASLYARYKGYRFWRSFTTGKPQSMGGIPHDIYGMTTRSVHRYVLGSLKKLGLDESQITKFTTGGPDGDLGSNEILISKDKTIAVVDGSGVLFDPAGLNREELESLARTRKMIIDFDEKKLSSEGFKVLVSDSNLTLPNGEHVESGVQFRNNFHTSSYAEADLFVPCGGRPESINLNNVKSLIRPNGTPKFKIIIEGANLFLTDDARMVLEEAGAILYKDASTNKGGVTSSSLEVLAGLAIEDQIFKRHMSCTPNSIPKFYQEYAEEITTRIEADADLEFECIWQEHERTKIPRFRLTDIVSEKINDLNDFIRDSPLWDNEVVRNAVLRRAIPQKLQELVPLEQLLERVPEQYTRAIFASYLASRYVYKYGVSSNEFAFFEFMQVFIRDAKKEKKK